MNDDTDTFDSLIHGKFLLQLRIYVHVHPNKFIQLGVGLHPHKPNDVSNCNKEMLSDTVHRSSELALLPQLHPI
ncbi:unnamed protein product [Citrullus colocynthis]|uniref:Uncharacterized protein n=1 Tax=Citrullus colocynthis TaxID=252529 RepID=A0ABP0XPD0_9ROSI